MSAKPIVAATDGSEESLRAVDWAAREAVLRGAPLRIVSAAGLLPRMVASQGHSDYQTVSDALRKDSDVALTTAAARAAQAAPDLLIDTDHLPGAPAAAVTESASGALMLVVGSRGIGAFHAMILGSVSRYAATHASSPVVVVRGEVGAAHRLTEPRIMAVNAPTPREPTTSMSAPDPLAVTASAGAPSRWSVSISRSGAT